LWPLRQARLSRPNRMLRQPHLRRRTGISPQRLSNPTRPVHALRIPFERGTCRRMANVPEVPRRVRNRNLRLVRDEPVELREAGEPPVVQADPVLDLRSTHSAWNRRAHDPSGRSAAVRTVRRVAECKSSISDFPAWECGARVFGTIRRWPSRSGARTAPCMCFGTAPGEPSRPNRQVISSFACQTG
jgi:hypothetical protein